MNIVVFLVASARAIAVSWLAAQIAATSVTKGFINSWPVWSDGIPGTILGWIVAISLVRNGKTSKQDFLPIVVSPMLAGGGVGLFRATQLIDSANSSSQLVLGSLGFVLLLAAVIAAIGFCRLAERWIGYCIVAGAITLGVLACFLSGQDTLVFEKEPTSRTATATHRSYRWFGSTLTKEATIANVTRWANEHDIEIPGMNVMLVASNPDEQLVIYGDLATRETLPFGIANKLDPFLESQRTHLELIERTPYWPLPAFFFLVGALLLCGTVWLPRDTSSLLGPEQGIRWVARVVTGFSALLVLAGFLSQANQYQSELEAAKQELEDLGAEVMQQDLAFDGKRIMSDAWYVKVPSSTGNSELARMAPYLDQAPGLALDLTNCPVSDDGILALRHVTFQMLYLRGTDVTNAVLGHFSYNIRFLDVRDTGVDIRGLEQHPNIWIEHLLISDSKVTLETIHPLYSVKGLEFIRIHNSQIQKADYDDWKSRMKSLPKTPVVEFAK